MAAYLTCVGETVPVSRHGMRSRKTGLGCYAKRPRSSDRLAAQGAWLGHFRSRGGWRLPVRLSGSNALALAP
ncbi:hypothetical protein ABO01nite_19230 [Asaia bogorensis NBRC 16594]|uniref:Uncharacterized protein n=1 Tax=Asaia bogorensis NBRC 16594 TaxID=1231624 RepID=A0AAN4R2M6_9PROT|nr:hypothetical protein ABO01nite_19230 [Asaia bogorensis NBRC 16594]